MVIKKRSSDYNIIDSGIMFSFESNGNFIFEIETEDKITLQIVIEFSTDDSGKQFIDINSYENTFKMTCINFLSSGTGTTAPLEIGSIKGKKIYITFWAYLEGNVEGAVKSRSIKYTLFIER